MYLRQIYEDFVAGDAEIRIMPMKGGGATRRVVKVLIGERLSQRVFGYRIQPLGPDAKISSRVEVKYTVLPSGEN